MDRFPRGRTAIVGAATFGLGEAPGYESIDLAAHASMLALEDAVHALDKAAVAFRILGERENGSVLSMLYDERANASAAIAKARGL